MSVDKPSSSTKLNDYPAFENNLLKSQRMSIKVMKRRNNIERLSSTLKIREDENENLYEPR